MKLMCDFPIHNSVPAKYVLPPEKRPSDDEIMDDLSVTLPVIDLQGAQRERRPQVVRDILKAGKEFGFFQACYSCMHICISLPCLPLPRSR